MLCGARQLRNCVDREWIELQTDDVCRRWQGPPGRCGADVCGQLVGAILTTTRRRVPDAPTEHAERVERRLVGPVNIFEDDDRLTGAAQLVDEASKTERGAALSVTSSATRPPSVPAIRRTARVGAACAARRSADEDPRRRRRPASRMSPASVVFLTPASPESKGGRHSAPTASSPAPAANVAITFIALKQIRDRRRRPGPCSLSGRAARG